MVGAFEDAHGNFTLSNISEIIHTGVLRGSFESSIQLSAETAFWGALFGFLLAYSAMRERVPRFIRPLFTTFSGVAANFGGIPLAFAFIATIGTIGVVTKFLQDHLGFNLYNWTPPGSGSNFSLFSSFGVAIVYLYFQIPLMLLVISPAIDGLKREWREASANLGASSAQFWRYVGIPVLLPSVISSFILLFGNAFAAYATAYALTSGGLNLVPILIGNDLTGNVFTNPHEGQALAFGMFVVLAAMMVVYVPLQRRTSRWAR
ncbi:MAG TPA: ABC transporter permease subunit [Gaiellaceae bacterium]|nr:ABC transporter permease subunit [Gaiellaceae bacterium]